MRRAGDATTTTTTSSSSSSSARRGETPSRSSRGAGRSERSIDVASRVADEVP
jgi:hypothetical protein